MWNFDDDYQLHITGADEPVAFGFSGFNEQDRLKYCPEVPMAEIEQAIREHGIYQHPTKMLRIGRTRDF